MLLIGSSRNDCPALVILRLGHNVPSLLLDGDRKICGIMTAGDNWCRQSRAVKFSDPALSQIEPVSDLRSKPVNILEPPDN